MSLLIQNLSFAYFENRKDALSNVSLELNNGTITVLTGPSGCGKSSLLYLAAGIYPHNAGKIRSGSIVLEGKDPAMLPPPQRCGLVGMMFQNPELQFCMDTVEHELIFCLENIAVEPEKIPKQVEKALSFCDIQHLKRRTLLSLSGGERQKVMLACIVALKPQWLLLDEPFANIDDDSAKEISQKIKKLCDECGMGVLAVDHRLDNWLEIADQICTMEKGQLSPERLDPKSLDAEQLEQKGIIVPGRSYAPCVEKATPGEVILALDHVSVFREEKQVIKDTTVQFKKGCIYAVVGPSGCGKSSLFGAICGMYPYQGEIKIAEKKLSKRNRKLIQKIGVVTQSPQDQFVSDSVQKELQVSLRKTNDKSEQILRSISLWRYRELSPYLLSQGQQRRLGVAALMACHCEVLLCDEPTYAQDRRNTIAIMQLLCEQARQHQVAVIFSTHDRQLAMDYADRILEYREGVFVWSD